LQESINSFVLSVNVFFDCVGITFSAIGSSCSKYNPASSICLTLFLWYSSTSCLALSRAFGDKASRRYGVIPVP
jgi:hypothetical protein